MPFRGFRGDGFGILVYGSFAVFRLNPFREIRVTGGSYRRFQLRLSLVQGPCTTPRKIPEDSGKFRLQAYFIFEI
jgi:hypothetical protein